MEENLSSYKGMSDKMAAGQRLMAGFDGVRFNEDLKFLIGELNVGGLILFSRNISSPSQIRELTREAQSYAASLGKPPLFIAIDQEGGTVARLKAPFTLFPEGQPGLKTPEAARHFAETTAREMGEVGLNMNLTPVLDVEPEGFSGVNHQRVFGGDCHRVADLGSVVIETLQKNGVMAVGKHFPGIGRTSLDSHFELPYLETPFEILEQTDLVPFKRAIQDHVSGIMLSHILYQDIDPEWPASLSQKISKALLRERLGFQGVVLTDDLDMKAIQDDIPVLIRRIVDAEIDIVLICHKGPKIEAAFNEMVNTITASENNRTNAIKSVERIFTLKRLFLGMPV